MATQSQNDIEAVRELIEPEYVGPQHLDYTSAPFSVGRHFRIEVSVPGLARKGETLFVTSMGTTYTKGRMDQPARILTVDQCRKILYPALVRGG